MERYDLSEARIYVGTYAKYNNGSLEGGWIELSECYDWDEFMDKCRELHQDEEEPEWMFQAWENIPDGLVCEGRLDSHFFELRDEWENMDEFEKEAFWVWVGHTGQDLTQSAYSLKRDFDEAYVGCYGEEEAFAREQAMTRKDELSDFALRYFDYERYAEDLFEDGYFFEDGFVFREA